MSETFLTKAQGRRIAGIIGDAQGCGAIWNVIMGDLDNPYCDGFVIGGRNKEQRARLQCTQWKCERSALEFWERGTARQTTSGFIVARIAGWYCPTCGGSYGGSR